MTNDWSIYQRPEGFFINRILVVSYRKMMIELKLNYWLLMEYNWLILRILIDQNWANTNFSCLLLADLVITYRYGHILTRSAPEYISSNFAVFLATWCVRFCLGKAGDHKEKWPLPQFWNLVLGRLDIVDTGTCPTRILSAF